MLIYDIFMFVEEFYFGNFEIWMLTGNFGFVLDFLSWDLSELNVGSCNMVKEC